MTNFAFSLCASAGGSRLSRRHALQTAAGGLLISICNAAPAYALKPGAPSRANLLKGSRRSDLTEEEQAEGRERIAEERQARLEKQRELQASADRRRAGLETTPEPNADLEANLRASYYYPQARKRYLPRVKRAYEILQSSKLNSIIGSNDYVQLSTLSSGPLADAILPMQLYASSLAGQGLSLAPKFVQSMDDQATKYDTANKKLLKACKKKDSKTAMDSIETMRNAIVKYRSEAKLEADDFGIGEVPEGSRVGSGFGNNNPALYNRNLKSILDNEADTPLNDPSK